MLHKIYQYFHHHYHRHYYGVYAQAKKLFIFDLGLLALALFMFGAGIFFFFWSPGLNSLIDLSISIGPDRIKSGERVQVTVSYTNRSKVKINNATLALRLPAGFIVDRKLTSVSTYSEDSVFKAVKEIPAGANGHVSLYGWLWTVPGDEDSIIASLTYTPENSKRSEQKLGHYIVVLPDSLLASQLNMASSSFVGQPVAFAYSITNNSSESAVDVMLKNNWPTDIFSSKKTKFSLSPSATKEIKGAISAPSSSGKYNLEIQANALVNNHSLKQTTAKQTLNVFSPAVTVATRIATSASFAEPGGILPIEITWQNLSENNIKGLRIRLAFNYPIVDLDATAQANNLRVEKNYLIIDGANRTSLSSGQKKSSDTFTVNVYLKSSFGLAQTSKAYLAGTPYLEAIGSNKKMQFSFKGTAEESILLATEASFLTTARYYTPTGDQLGRGPLPPQAGKTTKYWIFAQIKNTTNPLENISFKTSLPTGVALTGRQSVSIGDQIQYNSSTRAITWRYDSLPAGSQTGIYFEVQVTPTASQVGQSLPLTDKLYFSATDEYTEKNFNYTNDGLTNVLPSDDKGAKKGYLVTAM